MRRHSLGRRLFVGTIATVATLTVVVICFYAIALKRGRADWERYAADAKARGVTLSLREFVFAPIPDDENIAAIPLFQRLAASRERLPESGFRWPEVPPKFSDEKNPVADFEAWKRYVTAQKWITDDDRESAAAATLRGLDAHFGEEWEQLRAAVERPRGRFPVDTSKGTFASQPHLNTLLRIAQLGGLRASAQLSLGDAAAAYRELRPVLRLSSIPEPDPMLIGFLLRSAALAIPLEKIRLGLNQHAWGKAELEALSGDLAQIHLLRDYRFALETERAAMNDFYADLIASKWKKEELQPIADFLAISGYLKLLALYPKGWVYDNQVRSNQFSDAMLGGVDFERERYQPNDATAFGAKPANHFEAARYFIYFLGAPIWSNIETKALHTHTSVRCARLALELETWRAAHGAYPSVLSELPLPDNLSAHDIIGGEPLHYRVTADGGYILYSVGSNGRDDGGVESPKKKPREDPDWVWRIDHG